MPFTPTLQALIGPYTWKGASSYNGSPNWSTKVLYVYGTLITDVFGTLSTVNILTGVEGVHVPDTTLTIPLPHGFLAGAPPTCLDSHSSFYVLWIGVNGGGLIQTDGTTLAQTDFGGGNGLPPDGFNLQGGTFANITVGSTDFILAISPGGSGLHYVTDFDEVTFAGRFDTYGTTASIGACCAGKTGSGLGFIAAGAQAPASIQELWLQKVHCIPGGTWTIGDWPVQNSNITFSTVTTFVPSDIDVTWTEIYQNGICVDQTDGHPMIWCNGGATTQAAIVKVNGTTGAIIWISPVPRLGLGGAFRNNQFSSSLITNNRLCVLTGNPGPNTVTEINTVDGSSSSYTAGLSGLSSIQAQCYNDALGGILLEAVLFNNTTGSPTLLNSTPTSFGGFAMLYVAPVPPAPTNPRRFLAECGPIRLGFSTPSVPSFPPLPPLPPPPPPPPVTVTDITTEADEPIITEASSNLITET